VPSNQDRVPPPERLSKDARRAQLLDIAVELFSAQGYHLVSMDDIALVARVSKPVLYRHFPSKLDLYLATVDSRAEVLAAAVDEALSSVQDAETSSAAEGRAVVRAVVTAYFRFVEESGGSASLLFESDVSRDEAVRPHLTRTHDVVAGLIADRLTAFTGMPARNADLLAAALISMAQAAATHRFRDGHAVGVDEAVDLVSALAWGGVAKFIRAAHPPAGPGSEDGA